MTSNAGRRTADNAGTRRDNDGEVREERRVQDWMREREFQDNRRNCVRLEVEGSSNMHY
jgi:hypothetical protein